MKASDFEIRNYEKLDNILSKLCALVVEGQKTKPDHFGKVAAAVLDPDNNLVARLNCPGKDGRIHAERAAMEAYEEQYGDIPDGSIVLTTLSPCSEHMTERDGPSCTDYINNSNIKKVYCGYTDPTQDENQREFNILETKDVDIRDLCKTFADTFINGVNEGKKNKRKARRRSAYGPGLFGGYGYYAGYGGDSSGDGGGGESVRNENFADGKNPQDKGDSKRHGVPTKASVSTLRKVAKQGGRKGQLAHWMANMKSGKAKKK
jgi:pyrimidine deaminase RibD-like protein